MQVNRAFLALVALVVIAPAPAQSQIRPQPAALALVSSDLLDRLRADSLTYFRFVNRAWTSRVCELFADVPQMPIVRLHGDAHVEQFALTSDQWGLDDFDDSARGPMVVDIVRFLGSIDLAARQRGWARDRDALWDRFFEGLRQGLSKPEYRPPPPDIVRELRGKTPVTREAFLAWGETQMQPMEEILSKAVVTGMEEFALLVRSTRPELAPGYFAVKRAGWLRIGVGSAVARKVLIRVQGPTTDPEDDELIEAKEVTNLEGLACLEQSTTAPAVRVIHGTQQLGRLKHNILAVGPSLLIPAAADRAEHWLDWWVSSWEPSYREVRLSDIRNVEDLAAIAYDSGMQLGAAEPENTTARQQAVSLIGRLEGRIRKDTSTLVEELFAGWRELARP
jgi:hypothetical protein